MKHSITSLLFQAKAATTAQPPVQSQNEFFLASSSTRVLSDDDIDCSICFDGVDLSKVLKIPRILPCGHSFCSECLAHLVQVDRSLKYPKCNLKIQNVILETIPRNYYLMEKLVSTEKPNENETPMCQTCESGDHVATHQCVDCEELTCSAMVKAHTVAKAMRHHRVLPLDEPRDFFRKKNSITGASPLMKASCPQHVRKQLEVYDSTCRKAICSICALLPEHRGEALQF
jgi:hypothetical protein